MRIYCNGTAKIKDKTTGQTFKLDKDEMFFDALSGGEGGMGASTTYASTIDHPVLGELTWEIVEYPVNCQDSIHPPTGNFDIVEDFSYGLEHTPDD